MQFFEDTAGRLYPVDQIERCVPAPYRRKGQGEREPPVIHLKKGATVEVYDSTIDWLRRSAGGVIPAQLGFYVLGYHGEAGSPDEPYISEDPVIGWQRDSFGTVAPLVLDGEFEAMQGNHGILHPDGRVYDLSGMRWASRTDWEQYQREVMEDSAKDQAAKAP